MTSIAAGPSIQPASPRASLLFRSWQHGRTATRALAARARSSTRSVSAPHAWLDTTTSVSRRSNPSNALVTNSTRPDSLGHASTATACSRALERGSAVSMTTADGDESSSSSITCASRPCPPPRSITRPPRKRRRTRLAISHVSYSSFRGRHPARQAARPTRSNSVSPANRPTSCAVSRLRDDAENMALLPAAGIASEPRRHRRLALGGGLRLARRQVDLLFELFVVGQAGELIHEHQRVLRGNLELLAAARARDLVVEAQQVVSQLGELGAVALVGAGREPGLLRSPDPADAVLAGP